LLVLSLAFGVAAVPLGVLLAYWVTRLQARTHAPSPSRKHRMNALQQSRFLALKSPKIIVQHNHQKEAKFEQSFRPKVGDNIFIKCNFGFSTETIIWLKTSYLFGEETQFSFGAFFLFS
jgi:hypothetical protein